MSRCEPAGEAASEATQLQVIPINYFLPSLSDTEFSSEACTYGLRKMGQVARYPSQAVLVSIEILSFAFGIVLIAVAVLGGGFELKELKVPKVGGFARFGALVVGCFFIATGLGLSKSMLDSIATQPSQSPTQPSSSFVPEPSQPEPGPVDPPPAQPSSAPVPEPSQPEPSTVVPPPTRPDVVIEPPPSLGDRTRRSQTYVPPPP
jgi:hypothetical protein